VNYFANSSEATDSSASLYLSPPLVEQPARRRQKLKAKSAA
jgi:hypothetical protein